VAPAEIAMIKGVATRMAQAVPDRAVQVHGGVSGDFGLVEGWALARTLRLADRPDEVHINSLPSSNSIGQPNCGANSGRRRAAQSGARQRFVHAEAGALVATAEILDMARHPGF
jgi:hypothetical protein